MDDADEFFEGDLGFSELDEHFFRHVIGPWSCSQCPLDIKCFCEALCVSRDRVEYSFEVFDMTGVVFLPLYDRTVVG